MLRFTYSFPARHMGKKLGGKSIAAFDSFTHQIPASSSAPFVEYASYPGGLYVVLAFAELSDPIACDSRQCATSTAHIAYVRRFRLKRANAISSSAHPRATATVCPPSLFRPLGCSISSAYCVHVCVAGDLGGGFGAH